MRLDMIDEDQKIPGKVNYGQAGLAKWQGYIRHLCLICTCC